MLHRGTPPTDFATVKFDNRLKGFVLLKHPQGASTSITREKCWENVGKTIDHLVVEIKVDMGKNVDSCWFDFRQ